MYVGGRNIHSVLNYLRGYDHALQDLGVSPTPLAGFSPWIHGHFLIFHQAWSPGRILLHSYGSDRAAIAALPRLYEAFLVARDKPGIEGINTWRDRRLEQAYGRDAIGLLGHQPESSPTDTDADLEDLDRWYYEPLDSA